MVEILTLKVQRVDELSKIYIVEYEEKLIRVHMVQEQVGKGNPGEIVCRIEKSENYCYITQDMQTLLRRHYKEGDEVMYRIEKTTPTFYLLKDNLGYQTYLDKKYQINPTITPKIKCRIKSIGDKRCVVELIEKISVERSQFTIGFDNMKALFDTKMEYAESVTNLLLSDNLSGYFDSECYKWIYTVCKDQFTDIDKLRNIQKSCLDVLENSTLLKDCNVNEREVLEERFSTLIEQIGYYIQALEYVKSEKEGEMIDELLRKLQKTGYVFHPKKMFYIMMCIFLIKSKGESGSGFLDEMMPKVFDTLRSCDINNWKRPPFKIVWIKLLEFFIQSLDNNQDRLTVDRKALANMVQSLALQFNLAENDDDMLIDPILNLSMLYRYCAKVGVIDPMKMLDVAYHTLIGVIQEEPHMINYTDDPDRMVNVIYNQVKEFIPDGISSLKYEGKDADILVSNNTISIVPKAYDADFCHDMVPDYLELWHNLQVRQFTKPSPIGKQNRKSIQPYKRIWADALNNIISTNKRLEKKSEVYSRPKLGEEYGIIITKQTAAETPTFECLVVDPDDVVGRGVIRMADMVGYATPTVGLFSFEKNGKPMIFSANVVEQMEDGTYRFESKTYLDKLCNDYRYDNIDYTDKMYCVVTGGNTLLPFYAVSEQGFSMAVRYDEGNTPIQMPKGTVIEVGCIEGGRPGFMNAIFLRIAHEKQLTLAEAFNNLINIFSGGDVYEETVETEEEVEGPDVIEKERVREIMNIIDNVASLENDYIKAYNYLGFSRMMAHVMEDEEQIKYYASKMALIELLYEFDINNSISADLINRFQQNNAEFFTQHSTLHQQFRKLQIVSYLGHDEHNRELCEIACETSNPDLVQLAQLILSFNFMKKTNMLAQASDVHEHIKELLKLQKKENPKKDYGQETFTKEFKTSVICPPDTMHPDPSRQTHKIMEEICAFLNAEGGVLYIGVDDKTHLERGIEEDLKHPLFEGSKDKYDTYVRNKINQMLVPGELADHCISTSFDEDAHTTVYVINIKPCPQPISIDGVFYERRGTSSRHVSEEYQNAFISNRLQMAPTINQQLVSEIVDAAKHTATDVVTDMEEQKDGRPLEFTTGLDSIKTSEIRMYRHKDDDIQSDDLSTYINIFNDNQYSVTPQKLYDCLSLGLYDEELKGMLVVVYETGEISKIHIDELVDTEEWVEKPINNKSKIVFVSPAMPDDVLSILFHSKNTDYYRFISVESLDKGTFNTCMRPFYTGQIDQIIECEILSLTLNDRIQYKNFLDISNDKAGADSKKQDGKKAMKAIEKQLGK